MRLGALVVFGLIGLPGLGLASTATAQLMRPSCTPVSMSLGITPTAPGGTGLGDFPVFVHYMVNEDRRNDDPTAEFPPAALTGHFAPGGAFNRIWGAHGITFVLVGAEKCPYKVRSLDPNFTTKRERFPRPDANPKLPLTVFGLYNARHYQVGPGTRPFKGLDLYIFSDIEDAAGYGSSPKFKTVAGVQRIETEGGVLLGPDCKTRSNGEGCGRAFAHEAGHFLSLCHCCTTEADPNLRRQWSTCTTSSCPGFVAAGTDLPDCGSSAGLAERLMAANWLHAKLEACEIAQATSFATRILQ